MAYEKILLSLTIFTSLCMLQVSGGKFCLKIVPALKKCADECSKKENATMTQRSSYRTNKKEQMDIVTKKSPQSESGKKAFICILLCNKMIQPETCQVNMEGVKEMSKKCGKTKQMKEKMIKAGKTCQAEVAKKVKSCQPVSKASDVIFKCLIDQELF